MSDDAIEPEPTPPPPRSSATLMSPRGAAWAARRRNGGASIAKAVEQSPRVLLKSTVQVIKGTSNLITGAAKGAFSKTRAIRDRAMRGLGVGLEDDILLSELSLPPCTLWIGNIPFGGAEEEQIWAPCVFACSVLKMRERLRFKYDV